MRAGRLGWSWRESVMVFRSCAAVRILPTVFSFRVRRAAVLPSPAARTSFLRHARTLCMLAVSAGGHVRYARKLVYAHFFRRKKSDVAQVPPQHDFRSLCGLLRPVMYAGKSSLVYFLQSNVSLAGIPLRIRHLFLRLLCCV